mgnify:CR=1 FL=1
MKHLHNDAVHLEFFSLHQEQDAAPTPVERFPVGAYDPARHATLCQVEREAGAAFVTVCGMRIPVVTDDDTAWVPQGFVIKAQRDGATA